MANKVTVDQIKTRLMRPSLTSYFSVVVPFPADATLRDKLQKIIVAGVNQDKFYLNCCEASLPGSSLATFEIDNDRTGVTERHAYRRIFDQKIDLSFYVDADQYLVIRFFEAWMKGIVNQDDQLAVNSNYNYRAKYPNQYTANQGLVVTKFERDYKQRLNYNFIRSFPVSINSMPLSYDGNDILKCTVSMSYIRYTISDQLSTPIPEPRPTQQNPPTFGGTYGPETDFVERDTATGARMDGGDDGPLLLPDGSPVRDSRGNLRSMF